ncbi:hypothetical protein SLS62_009030 [Diatrype stigma]|uniref:Heterokaryon incompatibility domain-containing protein n=1 Tax=Diatrype stigma TaxID=117547 RepID=A0AAN9YM17_9PEZI
MIRLLQCGTWEFETFRDKTLPKYAILSHTWKYNAGIPEDMTYQELKTWMDQRAVPKRATWQASWEKVEKARDIAWELGFRYIWIDSCCIDKQDSSELTEAINSMYQWYAQSGVCIAYLSDLDRTELGPCRWFERGWTLQELIAPSKVLFYNKDWKYCGSRNGFRVDNKHKPSEDLSVRIAEISSIDKSLLSRNDSLEITRSLSSIPACQKMSWASKRDTTKPEDMAYCLIGIFGINHMHHKAGEGRAAFIRLQEEIIKQSSDPTLFAWLVTEPGKCNPENLLKPSDIENNNALFKFDEDLHGIFACHPREFQSASDVKPTQPLIYNDEIAVTSKGVKFAAVLEGCDPCFPFKIPLHCYKTEPLEYLGMELRWVGGDIYARTNIKKTTLIDISQVLPGQDHLPMEQQTRALYDLWN